MRKLETDLSQKASAHLNLTKTVSLQTVQMVKAKADSLQTILMAKVKTGRQKKANRKPMQTARKANRRKTVKAMKTAKMIKAMKLKLQLKFQTVLK